MPVTYVEPEPVKPEKPFTENTGRGKSGLFAIVIVLLSIWLFLIVVMCGFTYWIEQVVR